MTAAAFAPPRFVRRTCLGPGEYRKNFRQIDGDVIAAVTSEEADRVTPLMSKIYLRLAHAPAPFWERDGVLRFAGGPRGDRHVTAWAALCELLGVASATARKALLWLHAQGVVGYFAGRNGVGIRIFLNRAASSIGARAGQKILAFPRASSGGVRASAGEAGFRDSFADLEAPDTEVNPRAPESGAEPCRVVNTAADPPPRSAAARCSLRDGATGAREAAGGPRGAVVPAAEVVEIVARLGRELGPALEAAAGRAAAREHERTREWLESRGLPKAARVAQREAYEVLRRHGVVPGGGGSCQAGVGRAHPARGREADPVGGELTEVEVEELAQACVAMLEVRGQAVEATLLEMSAEAGGFLRAEESPRVLGRAMALLQERRR